MNIDYEISQIKDKNDLLILFPFYSLNLNSIIETLQYYFINSSMDTYELPPPNASLRYTLGIGFSFAIVKGITVQ